MIGMRMVKISLSRCHESGGICARINAFLRARRRVEIGVLRSQCLDRRIATREHMVSEIAAREHQRNDRGARINWMFSAEQARTKMARAYPKITPKES